MTIHGTVSPTLDGVMGYLHSIPISYTTKRGVYRQLKHELAEENIRHMRHILQETSKLEKGWDGYGDAIPVNPAVITLIGKVLDTCRPDYLVEWMLAPNVNGTMLLEQDDAAISIAPRQFSFYAENGDNYIDGEGLESTVPVLINTIKKINLFMQE